MSEWVDGSVGPLMINMQHLNVLTNSFLICFSILLNWTSLVVQWLRISLPMQGTRVQALVREDPTCRGATKPVRHNY